MEAEGTASEVGGANGAALQSAAAATSQWISDTRQRLRIATGCTRLADHLAEFHTQPASAVDLIDRSQAVLESAETDPNLRPLAHAIRIARSEFEARAREEAKSLVSTLPAAIEEAAIPIDAGSRFPRLTTDRGLITITVRQTSLDVRVSARNGPDFAVPADLNRVVQSVVELRLRLLDRPFDAKRFLELLTDAYDELAVEDVRAVELRALAARVSATLDEKRPRLDEFAVDLGRLLVWPGIGEADRQPRLQHTKDSSRGLLVYGLEDGGLVLGLEMVGTKQ